jgi:endonuclease YncB( thermonuclease family)
MLRAQTHRPRSPNSSITARLRRRTGFRRAAFILILALAVTAALDRAGGFGYRGSDWAAFDRKAFRVERVVDGDTLIIRAAPGTAETPVKLIGVDAPRLGAGPGLTSDYWAERARGYARARAEGTLVTVRLGDTQTRDGEGRLMAYVYLSDEEMLNEALVRDGQVYADRTFPHRLAGKFEGIENQARAGARGLWDGVTEDEMPSWRREWLAGKRRRAKRRQAASLPVRAVLPLAHAGAERAR